MDAREKLEYPKIYDFFIIKNNINKIIPIIDRDKKQTPVSLSILDWFVTNYAKQHKTSYFINKKKFDVNSEYKCQLIDYKKEYFDPFNRGGKLFKLSLPNNKSLQTTFRQLNFLRWALKSKVIQYVTENSDVIKKEYKEFKNSKEQRISQSSGKRSVLKKPVKNMSVNSSKTVIKFKS